MSTRTAAERKALRRKWLKPVEQVLLDMIEKVKIAGKLPPHEEQAFLEKFWTYARDLYGTINIELKSGITADYITLSKHGNFLTVPPTARVLEIRFMGKKVPEHLVRISRYWMEHKEKDMRLVERKCDEMGCFFKWYARIVGDGHLFTIAKPEEIVEYARRYKIPVWSVYKNSLKVLYDVDGHKAYGVFYAMSNPRRLAVLVSELASYGLQPLALGVRVAVYPAICKRPITPAIIAYKPWEKLSGLEKNIIETHLRDRLERIDKDIAKAWNSLPFVKRLAMLESIWDLLTETLKKNYVEVEVPLLAYNLARMMFEKEYEYYERELKAGRKPTPPVTFGTWIYGNITIFLETTTYVPKYILNLLLSGRKEDQAKGIVELARLDPYITWRQIQDIVTSMRKKLLVGVEELHGKPVDDYAVIFTRRFPADLYRSLKPVVISKATAQLLELVKEWGRDLRLDVILKPSELAKTKWDDLLPKERELVLKALLYIKDKLPDNIRLYIDTKFYPMAWSLLPEDIKKQIPVILSDMLSGKPEDKVRERAEKLVVKRKTPPVKPDADLCEWEEYIMHKRDLCLKYRRLGINTIGDYLKATVAYMKLYYDLKLIRKARFTIPELINVLLTNALFGLRFTTEVLHGSYEAWFLMELLKHVYAGEYEDNYIDLSLGDITTPKKWEKEVKEKPTPPPKPLVEVFKDEDWKKILSIVYTRVRF